MTLIHQQCKSCGKVKYMSTVSSLHNKCVTCLGIDISSGYYADGIAYEINTIFNNSIISNLKYLNQNEEYDFITHYQFHNFVTNISKLLEELFFEITANTEGKIRATDPIENIRRQTLEYLTDNKGLSLISFWERTKKQKKAEIDKVLNDKLDNFYKIIADKVKTYDKLANIHATRLAHIDKIIGETNHKISEKLKNFTVEAAIETAKEEINKNYENVRKELQKHHEGVYDMVTCVICKKTLNPNADIYEEVITINKTKKPEKKKRLTNKIVEKYWLRRFYIAIPLGIIIGLGIQLMLLFIINYYN